MIADKDDKTVVPRFSTAHEVLVTFFPAHDGHTINRKKSTQNWLEMVCSCGRILNIDPLLANGRGARFAEVLHGVRNVPMEH